MKTYLIANLIAILEKEHLSQGRKEHAAALHEVLSILRRASHEDDDPISEPARAHLFPLMKRAHISLEEFKQYLEKTVGIHSTKAIPWFKYDEVAEWLILEGNKREECLKKTKKRPKKKVDEQQLSFFDKKAM